MPSKADDDLFGESSSDEELAPVAKKGKDENKAAAGKKSSEFAGYLSWPAGRTLERGFYISYVAILNILCHPSPLCGCLVQFAEFPDNS